MEYLFFFLSIGISSGLIMLFRYLDANNRSFEKIHKLSKKIEQELEQKRKEEFRKIADLESNINTTLGSGKAMLQNINSSLEGVEKRFSVFSQDRDRINAFFKKIEAMEDRSAEHGKELKELQKARIFHENSQKLLKSVIKEVKEAKKSIEDLDKEIEVKKQHIHAELNEYETRRNDENEKQKEYINSLIEDSRMEFKTKTEQIHYDLDGVLKTTADLKEGFMGRVETDFENLVGLQSERIKEIEKNITNTELELQKSLEDKIGDYSTYITRLEERIEHHNRDIFKKMDSRFEKGQLDMHELFTQLKKESDDDAAKVKNDTLQNVASIYNEYERKYKKFHDDFTELEKLTEHRVGYYGDMLSDSNERLESLKASIDKAVEDKKAEIDDYLLKASRSGLELEGEVFDKIKENLAHFSKDVENTTVSIDSHIQSLEDKISEKNDQFATFKSNMEEVRSQLEQRQIDFEKTYSGKVDKVQETIQGELDQLTAYLNSEKEKQLEEIKNTLMVISDSADSKTNELRDRFDVKYGEVETRLLAVQDDMEKRARDLQQEIAERGNTVQQEILKRQDEIEDEIADRVKEFKTGFLAKQEEMEDSLSYFLSDAGERIENNTNTLNHLEDRVVKTKDTILDAIEEVKIRADKEIAESAAALRTSINVNVESIISEYSRKLKEVETGYFEKGKALLEENKAELARFGESHQKMSGDIAYLQETIENDVRLKIDRAKEDINRIFDEGSILVKEQFRNLDESSRKKMDEYRNDIESFKETIKDIDYKYEQEFREKIGTLDKKFEIKLNMYNEKYRIHINELYDKAESMDNELTCKLENIESDFRKRGERLVLESAEKYDLLSRKSKLLEDEFESMKACIENDIESKVEDGKVILNEQYRILESDTIKKINDYRNQLKKINEEIDTVSERYSQKYSDNVQALELQFSKRMEEIEKAFVEKEDGMLAQSNSKLNDYILRFEELVTRIDNLKSVVSSEVEQKVEEGKEQINHILDTTLNNSREYYNRTETELIEKIASFKNEYLKIQDNMKQIDDRFTARFLEHSGVLDKRIADIEKEVKRFEKSAGLLDKAGSLKEQLQSDIKELKKQIAEVKEVRLDMSEVEKKMMKLDEMAGHTNDKFEMILDNRKKVENIEAVIKELKYISDSAEERIDVIKSAKVMISGLENKVELISTRYDDLEKYSKNLQEKETEIRSSIQSLYEIRENTNNLNHKFNLLNKKYDDLSFKGDTFEKSLKKFEENASFVISSENKVAEVIDRFNQMDALVEDLEIRSDSIGKMREWLVKAETQMNNLHHETDRKIKVLQSLVTTSSEDPQLDASVKDEKSKRKTVLQLQSQGWTMDDIAKTLNLSIGEVEFILDLELNMNSAKR